MARVTGIGGIFIKSRDPEALSAWYQQHLGISYVKGEGATLLWKDDPKTDGGMSIFSVFPQTTKYFDPSPAPFANTRPIARITTRTGRVAIPTLHSTPSASARARV